MALKSPFTAARESFQARIFAALTLFVLLVSCVFSAFFIYQQHLTLTARLVTEGNLLASLLAHNTRLPTFAENRQLLMEAALGALENDHVRSVAIFGTDGQLLAEAARPAVIPQLERNAASDRQGLRGLLTSLKGPRHYNRPEYVEFFAPIMTAAGFSSAEALFSTDEKLHAGNQPVGLIRIVLDKEMLNGELERLSLVAVVVTALFLLIGIGTAYLVVRGITRPLGHLTEGVRALEMGDLSVTIPVETSDEIGALAGSFNTMVASLRQRSSECEESSRQLTAMNVILEERVRERTAELEAANRELESFNYSASHDLRAPLVRLNGLSKAFMEDCSGCFDEQGRHYLQRIMAVGEQLSLVVSAMGVLFQVQRRELSPREVNLSEIAMAVIYTLRESEPHRLVTVDIEPDQLAVGDVKLLWLVLENLLGNAWKFTVSQPAARIEFGRISTEGKKVFFIRDNGAGFDMNYADKLFAPFQRLHSDMEFPGTGVGLAIVRKIVSRHHGEVWLESEEGNGTTSYFTI